MATVLTQAQSKDIPREHVVTALTQLRRDWQEAAGQKSLIKVKGNVGLILADFATTLGLDTIERYRVLGDELNRDIEGTLSTTYTLR